MNTELTNETKTAIWLTAKSRMHAEQRLRRYDRVSHILLSWLSLCVIASAVVRGSIPSTATLDIFTAVVSVFVFAFSVVVFGFRFGETAVLHRECYLRLQKLHDGDCTDQTELNRQYHEVLGGYENHSDWDYESLVLARTCFGDRKIWGRNGEEISWTMWMLIKHSLLTLAFWIFAAMIFGLGLGTFILIAIQLQ